MMLPTSTIIVLLSFMTFFIPNSVSFSFKSTKSTSIYKVTTHLPYNNNDNIFYSTSPSRSLISLRSSFLNMAASRGGGSTKLDRKTVTVTKPTYREEIEKDWRLILHDDSVHTIQQVCEILSKTCPLCSGSRAYEVTLQVHMTGAATVAVANKKIVDEYSKSLQMAGLTVSTAPDEDFEPEQ